MKTASEFTNATRPLLDNLTGAAMRLTRNRAEADDLLQTTMLRAWRFRETFRPGTNVKAWLFTIMRNAFINDYKAAGRRGEIIEYEDWHHATSEEPTAADALIRAEELAIARELEAEIPSIYVQAMALRDNGMTYDEIAVELDVPIGTVMSRIYRGRRHRERLGGSLAARPALARQHSPARSASAA